MAPPLSPSVLLGQARATFERLRTPNAGLPRTENPLRDSRMVDRGQDLSPLLAPMARAPSLMSEPNPVGVSTGEGVSQIRRSAQRLLVPLSTRRRRPSTPRKLLPRMFSQQQ
jgi:hypothetical protein